jgi:hypothetical protein
MRLMQFAVLAIGLMLVIQPYLDHSRPNLRAFAVQIAIRAAPECPETCQVVEDYIRRIRTTVFEAVIAGSSVKCGWMSKGLFRR